MNKSYLVLVLAAIIFVSGCTQATIITEAFKKFSTLEAGPGYTADYDVKFSMTVNDKMKAAVASDPQAAASLGQLDKFSDIKLKLSEGKKGKLEKSYIDISGLGAILGGGAVSGESLLPFKSVSVYQNKNDATVCLETSKDSTKCAKSTKEELSKKLPGLASALNSANQFSQQDPTKVLGQFKVLYDKGALKLGPQGTSNVLGKQCDQISYTVGDLSKLDSKELLAALGPFGSQLGSTGQVSEKDLGQLSFLFQKMIKEIKQDFCLDKETGFPLMSSYSIEIDISQLVKALASSFGASADEQAKATQKIPEGAGFVIKFAATATSFKTPVEDSAFNVPADSKFVSPEELAPKAESVLPGNTQTADGTEIMPAQ